MFELWGPHRALNRAETTSGTGFFFLRECHFRFPHKAVLKKGLPRETRDTRGGLFARRGWFAPTRMSLIPLPAPCTHTARPPPLSASAAGEGGTSVTTDDPARARRRHPEAPAYLRAHRGLVRSTDLGRCGAAGAHRHSAAETAPIALKPSARRLCRALLPGPPPRTNTDFHIVIIVRLLRGAVQLGPYRMWPFQIGVVHGVTCISSSSMSFRA